MMRVSAGLRVSLNHGERGGGSSSDSVASGFQYFSCPGWRRLGRVSAPVHMLLRVETSDTDSDRLGLTQRVMSMPARAADRLVRSDGPARADRGVQYLHRRSRAGLRKAAGTVTRCAGTARRKTAAT